MRKILKHQVTKYTTLGLLILSILAIFILRTILAVRTSLPGLNDLFTALTILGSLAVGGKGYRQLHKKDWIIAIVVGGVVGVGMFFSTLYTPYPFFGFISGRVGQAVVRSFCTSVALLGGLVVLRQGGPVQMRLVNSDWRKSGKSILVGLTVGLPLSLINVVALQITQRRPIALQPVFSALIDALQPGIVEEVIYRFAFLGLIWLILRKPFPKQAGAFAGGIALLVHNFMHFDELFQHDPLLALGMGGVMAILWGLPPTLLALRRDLESAIAFHWIQDVLRFLTGF